MPVTPPSDAALPARVTLLDNTRGMAWMMLSVVAAASMAVAVRGVTLEMDSRMVVLLRATITLAGLVAAVAIFARWRRQMRFSAPGLHLVRGLLIAVSMHLGFYTLANLPLATATVLFFTAPIFATLFAALFQGERVGPRRLAAVAAGFLGALVILRPGFGAVHPAMLAALGSSLLFAAALSLSRRVAEADGTFAALFSSVAITVAVSLPLASGELALPSGLWPWVAMAVVVLSGVVRNVGDIQAYRHGEAAVLAPLAHLRIVLTGAAGYLLFDETIDTATAIGAITIVGSTLYIARREARLKAAR